MAWPEVLPFDRAVGELLAMLGVNGFVLGLVGIAFALHSWIGPARATVSAARRSGRVVRAVGARLRHSGKALAQLRPAQIVGSTVITAVVLAAQALTVGLCFVGGNFLAMIFDLERWQKLAAPADEEPVLLLQPDRLGQILVLDRVSGIYLALVVVAILTSYVLAAWSTHLNRSTKDRQDVGRSSECKLLLPGVVIALPAIVLLVLATIVIVVGGLLNLIAAGLFGVLGFEDTAAESLQAVIFLLQLAVTTILVPLGYTAMCIAASASSRATVESWFLLQTPPVER